MLTETSKIDIKIPRDREGTFDPKLIQRYQRRFPGFDEKIVCIETSVQVSARGSPARSRRRHAEAGGRSQHACVARRVQRARAALAGSTCRASVLDFLKSVTECKDKKVATNPRRFTLVEPPPFASQFLKAERPIAIDLALNRSSVPPLPWLGGRLRGDLRLRFGRLSGSHTINAFVAGLLRYQR